MRNWMCVCAYVWPVLPQVWRCRGWDVPVLYQHAHRRNHSLTHSLTHNSFVVVFVTAVSASTEMRSNRMKRLIRARGQVVEVAPTSHKPVDARQQEAPDVVEGPPTSHEPVDTPHGGSACDTKDISGSSNRDSIVSIFCAVLHPHTHEHSNALYCIAPTHPRAQQRITNTDRQVDTHAVNRYACPATPM